ncbi:helix-turn-helix domain-containing protein [Actinomadura sp. NPDC048955]|uniref:helix-turn-helix domain-containing protein n=1 Tax=Actinomadura sp. NPDC048955 TaxID=3158228 RepID=UPI0033CCC1B7
MVNGWDFGPHQLLSPGDVAKIFRVTPKTVGQWAEQGKLTSVRTPGGARRFSRHQIEHYLHNEHPPMTETSSDPQDPRGKPPRHNGTWRTKQPEPSNETT